jgi:hypothetical protein
MQATAAATARTEARFTVYVVRLDKRVLARRKFREANPDYVPGKPCVYVGMTGLSPEERFANHRRGYKANRYVRDYGLELMPRRFERFNPMTHERAVAMEKELAGRLRRRGYAVWQG